MSRSVFVQYESVVKKSLDVLFVVYHEPCGAMNFSANMQTKMCGTLTTQWNKVVVIALRFGFFKYLR